MTQPPQETNLPSPVALKIGKLLLEDIRTFVTLKEYPIKDYPWTQVEGITLTAQEEQQAAFIQSQLINEPTHLLNEATIWARAIYPVLALAETDSIRAWAEITLNAQFPTFSISGIADGVLGKSVAGRLEAPYLVVVEAKRGIEAIDPIPQLYGELLAAAYINSRLQSSDSCQVFGCYTIADNWTFVRGLMSLRNPEKPAFTVEFSREYAEKYDILTILKILKSITMAKEEVIEKRE